MRRLPVLLTFVGFLVAATFAPAQADLVLVTKGSGKFVKLAGGKLSLKYKDNKGKDKTVSLPLAPQLKVRVKNPPVAFDAKGRLKKYTKEELAALKGDDPKEWGFEANLNDLKADQLIGVFLYRQKGAARDSEPIVGKVYILD